MKKMLVLGAGYVARPFVDYILENSNFELIVADVDVQHAQRVTQNRERTYVEALDIRENEKLEGLIGKANLVISLLPYEFHYQVAQACVKLKKSLITASYITPEISALDTAAKDAGVLILKEMGLDPGLDHMSAMHIIDKIKRDKGTIISFKSYCGGLAAPEANTNPWKYKFSWSPRGVLKAAQNGAKFLAENQILEVLNRDMLQQTDLLQIGPFDLEAYPNRDSMPYIDRYGLQGIETLVRYTLRFPGWVKTMAALREIGLADDKMVSVSNELGRSELLRTLLNIPVSDNLLNVCRQRAGEYWDKEVAERLTWLGLFDDELEKVSTKQISAMDYLVSRMIKTMSFAENERDMILLHHDFLFTKNGAAYRWESTLTEFGIPGGASAMAQTVAFPAAIAARYILEDTINLTGVHLPVLPEIYNPVLEELQHQGMVFSEHIKKMPNNT